MDFSKPWKYSDLILKVESESFHVHRVILSLNSPVFDRMFNSDFREKISKEIELPGKKVNEFKDFLEIIYDGSKRITDRNLAFLVGLSDEYEVTKVRSQCTQYIKEADKSGMKALKYIGYIRNFNLNSLEKDCLQNLKTISRKHIEENCDYQELDDSLKFLIMRTRAEHLEKVETTAFELLRSFKTFIEGVRANYGCTCLYAHTHKEESRNFDFDCTYCRELLKENNYGVLNNAIIDDMVRVRECFN